MAWIDAAEAARSIRADLKAAQKSGELPASAKFRVTSQKYAGGQSVYVRILELPCRLHSEQHLAAHCRGESPMSRTIHNLYSPEALLLRDAVRGIASRLHEDRSDISSDHFDNNFFLFVDFDSDLQRARLEAELALEHELRQAEEEEEAAEPRSIRKLEQLAGDDREGAL